jgi:hypothetical protein
MNPTTGTSVMEGEFEIGNCTEPGAWRVSVELFDAFGNRSTYSAAQLAANGFSHSVNVIALDWTPPSVRVPTTVRHTAALQVTFGEPTLWKGTTNHLTVYAGRTSVPGAWTCKNPAGTVVGCNAEGITVKTASFKPTVNFAIGTTYLVRTSGGIYDVAGNGPAYTRSEFKAT